MNVKITPQTLKGVINAPPSKSFAHRLLISAFLSGKKVSVLGLGTSSDVITTLNALKGLGAVVTEIDGGVTIERKNLPSEKVVLNMNDSGSSLRFLMPVVSALGLNVEFIGTERLLNRPISELVTSLNEHGAKIEGHTVNGKIEGGVYKINGGVSSQYITGLMLALSVLGGEIIIEGELVSKPYIDITLSVLKDFGVSVIESENRYIIKKGYNLTKTEFFVEGDWSGASFMLVAGALGGPVTVKGLNARSVQGDSEIIDIIKKVGGKATINGSEITVEKDKLNGIEVNIENIPDLSQIIAVLLAFAKGTSKITGVSRLKGKESDRISAIVDMLNGSGVKCEYINNQITISGGVPTSFKADGNSDHRTVMSNAILASYAQGGSEITGAQAHVKSYPEFFNDFMALGGEYVDI